MQITSSKDKEAQQGQQGAAHKATTDKLQAQIASLQRSIEEKDLSYNSNKDMIQALQSRLIEMEPELVSNREKIAQYERNATAQAVLKAEQSSLINSLRNDLKTNLDESEAARKRHAQLEEFKVKAEGQLLKLGTLTEQVQEYKSVIEEKDSLITRMRSEQQVHDFAQLSYLLLTNTCVDHIGRAQFSSLYPFSVLNLVIFNTVGGGEKPRDAHCDAGHVRSPAGDTHCRFSRKGRHHRRFVPSLPLPFH